MAPADALSVDAEFGWCIDFTSAPDSQHTSAVVAGVEWVRLARSGSSSCWEKSLATSSPRLLKPTLSKIAFDVVAHGVRRVPT
jgi:hypothetical protein